MNKTTLRATRFATAMVVVTALCAQPTTAAAAEARNVVRGRRRARARGPRAAGATPPRRAAHVEVSRNDCLEAPSDVPDALRVPADECLKLELAAAGVQIYTCTAVQSPMGTTYSFVLKAPEADLYDDGGNYAANHFLGPKWQYVDGSKLGAVAEANSPHAPNIPWLLLRVVSWDGHGVFDDVTHIQRLNTVGGTAPATGCDSTHVGAEVRINYEAKYLFYHSHDA